MSFHSRARSYVRTVVALEPGSTDPRCPSDARKMALARLMTCWDDPDPFWTCEMVLVAASELDLYAGAAARGDPALIDFDDFADVVGSKNVARAILGAAGFYQDGKYYTNYDPDLPAGSPRVVNVSKNYLVDALSALTEEAEELCSWRVRGSETVN